jgi:MFS family permease
LGAPIGTLVGGAIGDTAARARLRRDELAKGAPLGPRETDDAVARSGVAVTALSCAIAAPLAAAAIGAPSARLFFALVLPCEIALFFSSGPINVAILRSSPPALRASAMALSIFAIHALGDLWSPWIIGLVADHSSYRLAICICPLVFAVAAAVWWHGARTSARLTSTPRVR